MFTALRVFEVRHRIAKVRKESTMVNKARAHKLGVFPELLVLFAVRVLGGVDEGCQEENAHRVIFDHF